jgi:hypothetical protein
MSGRRSKAVSDALAAVLKGARPHDAAKQHGCHVRSVWRALRAEKAKPQ